MNSFTPIARPPHANSSEQVSYDVTKDGQRFLINTQVKNADAHPMTVILNWDAEMKKK
jgi:hypothetical protein